MRTEWDRAHWKREAGSVYKQLVQLALDHDHDPGLALALWEQFRSTSVRGSLQPQSVSASPADVRKLASRHRNSTVLVYAELGDTLAGWLYDNRGIHPFRTSLKAAEAGRLCAALQRSVARGSSPISQIHEQSRVLYDVLIGPVEQYLDPGRLLLLEPDGPCAGAPFELLMDRKGSYLIDRFALATSPGAFAERALSSVDQHVNKRLHAVVVENPRLGTDLIGVYPPLPNSSREAELMTAAFPSHTRLSGAGATLDAVLTALSRAEVFYFGGRRQL